MSNRISPTGEAGLGSSHLRSGVATAATMDPAYPAGGGAPPPQGVALPPLYQQGYPPLQPTPGGGMEMQPMPTQQAPLGFEGLMGPPDPNQMYPATPHQGAMYPPIENPTTNGPAPIGLEGIGYSEEAGTEMKSAVAPEPSEPSEERTQELEEKRETLFFRDGKRQIDYILAFTDTDDSKKVERRETFENNLREEGLELEYEDKQFSQDGKTHFVKVHAPWEVLTRMAELMSIKMPIKIDSETCACDENGLEYDTSFQDEGCCGITIPNPFELGEEYIKSEPDYFTADFSRERESMFIINNKDTFFNKSHRIMIVHELLLRTRYEIEAKDKFGIDRLLKQDVYTAAYPLHEGPYSSDHAILTHGPLNDRHLLYECWAKPSVFYYEQPLDLIRKYFGEKIAIYFSWLGFYTMMLIPASIVGVIVFIYGCATLLSYDPSEEICDETGPGNFTMCPLCDKRCDYWKLVNSCMYSRLTYLFDNYATVFFAGFMAIWSTMFLEFWKRKQAEIQYDWDVVGYELEEHMRPEFEAKCTHQKLNPVTQMMEPFLPIYSKIPRKVTSVVVVLFMICSVLAAVFGVIMYRIIIVTLLYSSDQSIVRQHAKITTSATAALLNLVVIVILNKLYQKVAEFLTDLERPRTDSDYEDSFTFKMFLFQFINYYSSIFYIAFFKGRLPGYPGKMFSIVRLGSQEECDPAGCLIELCIQLAIVMVGKQTFNNFKEIMLPKILNWLRSRGAKKKETEDNLYTRWEQDKDLTDVPAMGLFDEYLEMVIQFGFVTIFVAAFPLAPLFALINNVIEIRLDAYKYVTQVRRPVPHRAQDIGIWFGILKGVTFTAVLTNAFIVGWTSDFVPKLVYQYGVSEQGSLKGYINNSLSFFDVADFQNQSRPEEPSPLFENITYCRYADYRNSPWDPDPYTYTRLYWHVFTARLAFIIVFEHAVFFLTWLVAYLIPDIPSRVKQLMLRELYIAKEARYDAAFSTLHQDRILRQESEAKEA